MSKLNYMEKVDAWLKGEIDKLYHAILQKPFDKSMIAVVDFHKAIKEKILESYRNGQRSRRSTKETEPSEAK